MDLHLILMMRVKTVVNVLGDRKYTMVLILLIVKRGAICQEATSYCVRNQESPWCETLGVGLGAGKC